MSTSSSGIESSSKAPAIFTQTRRICVVSPLHRGGGAEYQMGLIMEALHQTSRFEIIYLAHDTGEAASPLPYALLGIGKGVAAPRWGYLAHFRPLYATLKRLRPDVIYQRVGCGYTGICALYAKRHGAHLVWHVAHDTDVAPVSLDGGRNFIRTWLEKRSVEFGLRHAHRIVVQTGTQAELLKHHYGRTADLVMPNVSPRATEPLEKCSPLLVAWIANLKPWKQPEAFVRLARALQDVPNVRFIMAGAMPSGRRDAVWLQPLLQDIDRTPNLSFLGPLCQTDVNRLLASATLFVNTSRHEGFPNTFIQAWLRGAVVASLYVNPDGVLQRENIGVHAGSEASLAACVRQLLQDQAERDGYRRRAYDYACARHSLANITALIDLIDACPHRGG